MRTPIKPLSLTRQLNEDGFLRQIKLTFLLAIILVAIFYGFKLVSSYKPSNIPEIKSAYLGYCLDDYHDSVPTSNYVDIWHCNGRASQDWVVSGNYIKHGKNPTSCLSVAANKLILSSCNKQANEQWTHDIVGYQNVASGLCMDAPNNQQGAQLVVASCNKLTQLGESWTPFTYATSTPPLGNCSGSEGQKVACYAQKQWDIWQSGKPSHGTLLNEYSDGNGYEEWCADFVSYVYQEAGYPFSNGERNGWDEYLAGNIQNMGFNYHSANGYEPQPGDVAYFDYPGGHVAIVVKGGPHPTFIYGDSYTTDPATGNGEMTENNITNDGSVGQVIYYLSPA
jgi:hypothetical protein